MVHFSFITDHINTHLHSDFSFCWHPKREMKEKIWIFGFSYLRRWDATTDKKLGHNDILQYSKAKKYVLISI